MGGGCRLHSHMIMSMSEVLKEAKLAVQFGVLWDGASSDCSAH